MKKSLLFICSFMASLYGAFGQQLHWAYSFTNPNNIQENIVTFASDGSGSFVIVGYGTQNVSMDVINNDAQYNAGKTFMAKYDSNAQLVWSKTPPTINTSYLLVRKVGIDASGNIYTCGLFSGNVDFDPGPGTHYVNDPLGGAYVQKLDPNGDLIWVNYSPVSGNPDQIAFKSNGNVILAGKTDNNQYLHLTNGDSVLCDRGMFLYELSSTGDFIGAYNIAMPETDEYFYIYELEVDADDNIYIGGKFDGAADFDMTENGTHWDTSATAYDAYIAKYNSNFELQWQKSFGDLPGPTWQPPSWDQTSAIEVDANGNVFAAGHFTWTCDFDLDDNPGVHVLQADDGSQSPNGFMLQYNSNGELQWVGDLGGSIDSAINNQEVIIKDMELTGGSLFITGDLVGASDFDPSSGIHYVYSYDAAMFFGHYSANGGALQSVFTIDTIGVVENNLGIELLDNGSFVTTGLTFKSTDFDPQSGIHLLEVDTSGSFAQYDKDVYIAKYSFTPLVGIDENGNEKELSIYPVPTQNELNINLPVGDNYQVAIFDAIGRQVMNSQGNGLTKLDVSSLSSGVYVVTATNKEGRFTGRFIK